MRTVHTLIVAIASAFFATEFVSAEDFDADGDTNETGIEAYISDVPVLAISVGQTAASIVVDITRESSTENQATVSETITETITYADKLTSLRTRSASRSRSGSTNFSMKWGDLPEITMGANQSRSMESAFQESQSFTLDTTEASEKVRGNLSTTLTSGQVSIGNAAGVIRSQLEITNFGGPSAQLSDIDVSVWVRNPSGVDTVIATLVIDGPITIAASPIFSPDVTNKVLVPIVFDQLNTAVVMTYLGAGARLSLHVNSMEIAPTASRDAKRTYGDMVKGLVENTALFLLKLPDGREKRLYVSPLLTGTAPPTIFNVLTALKLRPEVSGSEPALMLTALDGMRNTLEKVPAKNEISKDNIDTGIWIAQSNNQPDRGLSAEVGAGDTITVAFVSLRQALDGTRMTKQFAGEATSSWRRMSEPPVESRIDRLYQIRAPFITSMKDDEAIGFNEQFANSNMPSTDATALFEAGATGSVKSVICHSSDLNERPMVKDSDIIQLSFIPHQNSDELITAKAEDLVPQYPGAGHHPVSVNWRGHWENYWRGSTQIDLDTKWKSPKSAYEFVDDLVIVLGDHTVYKITDLVASGKAFVADSLDGRIAADIYLDSALLPNGESEVPACLGFRPNITVSEIGRTLKRGPMQFGFTARTWVSPFEEFWLAQPPGRFPKTVAWRKTKVLRDLGVTINGSSTPAGL